MATLYELSEKYLDLLDACEGEIESGEIENALNAVESDIETKVSNGIALIQTLKRRAESYDAEITRLEKLKKAAENNAARIKTYYLDNLRYIGKLKVATSKGTMSVVKSGGKRPLKIDNEDLIPLEFKKTICNTVIDKDTLQDALEQGEVIDGAHLEERGQYLKIS